jgi:hypothetical protein
MQFRHLHNSGSRIYRNKPELRVTYEAIDRCVESVHFIAIFSFYFVVFPNIPSLKKVQCNICNRSSEDNIVSFNVPKYEAQK